MTRFLFWWRRDADALSVGPSVEDLAAIKPHPPAPDRPTYEETKVESAIISFLVNEQPAGATLAQLTLALGFGRDEVEGAVDRLYALEIVTEDRGKMIAGQPPPSRKPENGNGNPYPP